jgi:hypothetical protein
MGDADLYPTRARLALLRDVDDGKVSDSDDAAPVLDLGDDGFARVADAIWTMRRAGWVELPPGTDEPDEPGTWRLTDAGRAVLEAGAP